MTTLDAKTVAALTAPTGKTRSGKPRTDAIIFDSEETLRGFGVRLRLDHNGKLHKVFIVQYRTEDGQRRQVLGKFPKMSAELARRRAAAWLAKVGEGKDPAKEKEQKRKEKAKIFSKTVEEYLALKKSELRVNSFDHIELYLTKPQYFGSLHNKPLNSITQSDISSCLDAIQVDSGIPSRGQAQKHLSAFFRSCMRKGHLSGSNPVANTEKKKSGPPRERWLKDHEIVAVWNACTACADQELGKVTKLLLLTGCRAAEIGGLRWSEVDLERGTITLPGVRTKNHREHIVPITDTMRGILETISHRARRDLLFGLWADTGFTSWNAKPKLEDGINEPWTFHDLRRTFRTGLVRLKFAPPHIAELCINHRKGGIEAVYDKYDYADEIGAAFKKWSDHIAKITGNNVVSFKQQA